MAKGITEAEYAKLKTKASRSVRFSDDPPRRASSRKSRTVSKRRKRRSRNVSFPSDIIPTVAVIGGVVLLGTYLFGRQSNGSYATLKGLGDAQAGQIGGAVGSILGSITGIPGVGQIAGLIGGLFGPSAHYTPSGMLYDTAFEGLKSNAVELADMMNELYAAEHVATRVPVPSWSMTSADDPKVGPYLAWLLNNPALASHTTPDILANDAKSGVYDAAIHVQESAMQAIQSALDGLESGTNVVVNGKVVPAVTLQQAVQPSQPQIEYLPSQPPAPAGSYAATQAVQPQSQPSTLSQIPSFGWLALAALGLGLLI